MEFVLEDVVTVLGPDGVTDPATDPALSTERLVALYRAMLLARRLDEHHQRLWEQGKVPYGPEARHEEAVLVGAVMALDETDWLWPSADDVGAVLARGVPLEQWAAHLFGVGVEPTKGRDAWVFSSRAHRVVSANPRLGSQITQAAGFAWASRVKGSPEAALVLLAEHASEAGEFHNGMNFAGVFRASAVFVCRASDEAPVAQKAFAYGLRAARVDGDDALAVYRVVRDAIERAHRGEGATLVEARVGGRDPVARMRAHLALKGLTGDEGAWESEADAAITAAIEKALAASAPAASTMFDDVYGAPPWHLAEQRSDHQSLGSASR